MNIGLVLPGFSADEADWCIPALRNLVGELARSDRVRVLALRYPHRAGRYDAFGARVIALGGADRRRLGIAEIWGRALLTLHLEHRREPFDVLHAFWATEAGGLAAIAGRVLGVPSVVSVAGGELVGFRDLDYGDQLHWAPRLKVALALRLADVVTAGSAYSLGLVRSRLRSARPGHLVRAPLGVDADQFKTIGPPENRESPRLVHVGTQTPVKDQATLLAATAHLRAAGIDARLDLAGSGPLKPALTSLAATLRIDRAVQFRGAVPHDQLPEFYRSGDLFVLSSRHEAQCMAVLEAASCGVPIVGTAVGVIPELAPHAAVAVDPGTPDALATAMSAVLGDPSRQTEMGHAARQRVEAEYEVRGCADRFRRIYRLAACG